MKSIVRLIATALASLALSAYADEKVLNLYSARHYQTDEALYANFTHGLAHIERANEVALMGAHGVINRGLD